MTRPLIGLTTYGRNEENWFSLPAEYVDSVRRSGGIPVLMPPGEEELDGWIETLDALILSGGGDIDPVSYEGPPHGQNYMMDRDRDRDEILLSRRVVEMQLPTLAICRGMQILNIAHGGSLIPHLPEVVGERVAHRSPDRKPTSHGVEIDPGSRLAAVLGVEGAGIEAASWHHQAVAEVAEGFRATAHAADGIIEAMEMEENPWLLAVQWHPELTAAEDPCQQRLFDALVRAARGEATFAADLLDR